MREGASVAGDWRCVKVPQWQVTGGVSCGRDEGNMGR